MRNPLFDSYTRTDTSHSRHNEDSFTFLDRVDDVCFQRVRELLNTWFGELPTAKAKTIETRFRSAQDPHVEAAFWELYLHAAFVRSPFSVQMEVEVGQHNENVDFVLSTQAASAVAFAVEARSVGDPHTVRERAKRLNATWDALNEAEAGDFYVWVQVEREGRQTPSGVELRKKIVPWLETLNRTAVIAASRAASPPRFPEEKFDVGEWTFLVRAMPLSDKGVSRPGRRGPLLGAGPIESAWGGSSQALLRGLKRKSAAKYDEFGLPYVLGLLDLHRFSTDDCLVDELFGNEKLQIVVRGDETLSTEPLRRENGYWRQSVNTRMSAVLYARHLLPWNIPRVTPELWLNPWALRPLSERLSWARTVHVADDGSLVRTPPKVTPAELFGLPDDWPGPERPFQRPREVAIR